MRTISHIGARAALGPLVGSLICGALFVLDLRAQTFNSGSTGGDGPLVYTTPGTYYFDPKGFNPPLNPAGDNIFNFTTITIGSGVTLKLGFPLRERRDIALRQQEHAATVATSVSASSEYRRNEHQRFAHQRKPVPIS